MRPAGAEREPHDDPDREEQPGGGTGTEVPVPGVTSMDHTADLALEIAAPDPTELLRRAAAGMMYLLLEEIPIRTDETRELRVSSDDLAGLLRDWLRELLFWHETEGFAVAETGIRALDTGATDRARVDAIVRGGRSERAPVREIKGVTLHGLRAEPRDDGWYGRVVFDV